RHAGAGGPPAPGLRDVSGGGSEDRTAARRRRLIGHRRREAFLGLDVPHVRRERPRALRKSNHRDHRVHRELIFSACFRTTVVETKLETTISLSSLCTLWLLSLSAPSAVSARSSRSKVDLRAELDQPSLQNLRRR